MVPQGSSAPLETFAAPDAPFAGSSGTTGGDQPAWQTAPSISAPASTQQQPRMPTGIPSSGRSSSSVLAADQQLAGQGLALLPTAQKQQGGGDLHGAASSPEYEARFAPRVQAVLYP